MLQVRSFSERLWIGVVTFLFTMVSPEGFVYSQESYRTFRGTIVISTEVNYKPVKYVSNELEVQLNYETAEFKFTLNKNSVKTDNITHLNLFKPEIFQFYGKLGIDYVKTDSHPTQLFDIEGTLRSQSGQELATNASGSLSHLYSNTSIACWLTIIIQLDRQEIEDFILDTVATDDMRIEIINTVLDEN